MEITKQNAQMCQLKNTPFIKKYFGTNYAMEPLSSQSQKDK